MRIFIFVELQQQRVNDDGNNLVPVERVSIPFACENNGNEPIITNDNDGSSIDPSYYFIITMLQPVRTSELQLSARLESLAFIQRFQSKIL